MRTSPLIRAGLISACLFAFAAVSLAQTAPSPAPGPTPPPLQIVYTGRLLGYFRAPADQGRDVTKCPERADENSKEADKFLATRRRYENAILVGTGDNFSPQLESRVFKADASGAKPTEYERRNKELYSWHPKKGEEKWYLIGDEPKDLTDLLMRGEGIVPADNVGCFLAAARF